MRTIVGFSLLLGMAVLAPGLRGEPDVLDMISGRLAAHDSLHGRFEQKKELSFLVTPFISRGAFTLSSTGGLTWLVEEPLRSEMIVRDSTVMLDGELVRDQGIGQFMAMIMQSFMAGELQDVRDSFTVSGELSDDQSWTMSLRPRALGLRAALSHIELRGDDFLERISIFELDETHTLIEFRDVAGDAVEVQARDAAD